MLAGEQHQILVDAYVRSLNGNVFNGVGEDLLTYQLVL